MTSSPEKVLEIVTALFPVKPDSEQDEFLEELTQASTAPTLDLEQIKSAAPIARNLELERSIGTQSDPAPYRVYADFMAFAPATTQREAIAAKRRPALHSLFLGDTSPDQQELSWQRSL